MKEKMKISKTYPIKHAHDIYTNNAEDYEKVVLLLHGFQLNGHFMYKRFEKLLPKDTLVIAPNAPFVVPLKKDNAWEPRYGWYFYDPNKKSFYINYEPAALWLSELMQDLNNKFKPLTIIGYSQGGFIAPKVAELIKQTEKVIGINAIFRSERFSIRDDVTYSQVHGTEDSIVSFGDARLEFNKIKATGANGDFFELKEDHFLNRNLVREALNLV